ncbi:MAG: phage tail protein [Kineosporiaceae bacterium]
MSQPAPETGAAPGAWVDPYRAHNFKLMIQGVTEGHFIECTGPTVTINTVEYREAGQSQVVHKVPTITTYGDVVLRYGLTNSRQLWTWFLATARGEVRRQNVSIVLLDSVGTTPVVQWDLVGALPVKWGGPTLRADAREIAVEEIVLSYETLDRAS